MLPSSPLGKVLTGNPSPPRLLYSSLTEIGKVVLEKLKVVNVFSLLDLNKHEYSTPKGSFG